MSDSRKPQESDSFVALAHYLAEGHELDWTERAARADPDCREGEESHKLIVRDLAAFGAIYQRHERVVTTRAACCERPTLEGRQPETRSLSAPRPRGFGSHATHIVDRVDSSSDNPLTRLIEAAFPSWQHHDESCGLRRAMLGSRWASRPDIIAVGDAIRRAGQFEAFVRRFRRTHPADHHRTEHDRQFWDAFVEGEALAWALDVAELGVPRLVDEEAQPDLYVPEASLWIEAKSIRESDDGRRLFDATFCASSDDDDPPMYGPATTSAKELETTWQCS